MDSREGNEIKIYVQIKQKRRLSKRRTVRRQEGTLIEKSIITHMFKDILLYNMLL